MNKLVIGILAHVDAGKTTLSESMLYLAGRTHRLGRVDNKDAYLDTHDLERERGITIFSQQALLALGDLQITLLDTPGHVDFAAEMERTLQVLDYAILVISGVDGVQGHTSTLWGPFRCLSGARLCVCQQDGSAGGGSRACPACTAKSVKWRMHCLWPKGRALLRAVGPMRRRSHGELLGSRADRTWGDPKSDSKTQGLSLFLWLRPEA
jgi:small GTP-binding protein